MIGGYVAMRDQLDLDPSPAWHLVDVDVSAWPMFALCGRRAPRALQRDVMAAADLVVDDACGRCVSVAARGGVLAERRASGRGPTEAPGAIA